MKDLLSKEYYWYKIHALLTKSSAYPPSFYRHAALPPFLQENLDPSIYDFSKISKPL